MNQLTEEEKIIVKKIESAGKWEALTYDITILIPCFLVVIISGYHDSIAGVFAGFFAYVIIRLWVSTKQAKTVSIIQSAIKKLSQEKESGKSV